MMSRTAERGIDVLFLGGDTARRGAVLSTLGPILCSRRSDLRLFRFTEPVHDGVPGLVFGQEKYDLLARTRMLVNIHRDDTSPGYFEWARMIEAMANGVAVVTEPSTGFEPLVPGEHFVQSDDIAGAVSGLLDDEERRAAIGESARRAVLETYPLAGSLGPILDELDSIDIGARSALADRRIRRNRIKRVHGRPLMPVFRPAPALRTRVFHALLAEQDIQRSIESVRCQIRYGDPNHDLEFATPAYARCAATGTTPEVSVVVTLYNYAEVVGRDARLARRIERRDDRDHRRRRPLHGRRAGRSCRAFMDQHPDLPILLLGRENNCGLPKARNHGIERARSDKVMIIDADNTVYPCACAASPTPSTPTQTPALPTPPSRRSATSPACAAISPGTCRGCARPTTSTPRR